MYILPIIYFIRTWQVPENAVYVYMMYLTCLSAARGLPKKNCQINIHFSFGLTQC